MMKTKAPQYKHRYVMLLDDNELDNYINEKIIQANYFSEKIYKNTSGRSALEFLNNISVSAEGHRSIYPEIIFVDLNMPMMDGFQFIQQMKNSALPTLKNSRFVILTSSVNDEDRKKANQIDSEIVFLNKPLNEKMLSEL